jgi:hypothetical protein
MTNTVHRTLQKEINGRMLNEIFENAKLTKAEKAELHKISKRVHYNYSDYPETILNKLRESARELGYTEFQSMITGRKLSL